MVTDCKKYAEVGVDVGGVGINTSYQARTVALFLVTLFLDCDLNINFGVYWLMWTVPRVLVLISMTIDSDHEFQ